MSYRSKVFYTGNGGLQNLSLTFPYLDITHVHVRLNDVLQEDDTWSWVTSETIAITAESNVSIELFRSTPFDPLVTFTNSSLLNDDDQNTAMLQSIYLIEELLDGYTLMGIDLDDRIDTIVGGNAAITFIADGGDYALSTGIKGAMVIPFNCTIVGAYLLADQTGSIVVDVWKDTYANFPPTDADSITASAPLTISNGVKAYDTTLMGWATTITAGDTLKFNVDSCATITRATVVLVVNR